MNLAKRVALALAGIAALRAQAPTPKFEVASIRLCEPAPAGAGRRGGLSVTPGRLHATCMTASALAQIAYGVGFRYPIEGGGPAWSRSDGYDIEAKAEGNPKTQEMQGPMLQELLENRLQLKMKSETR
jgi:uncharacterized protein (TIGR03435 family)